jgi:hypothetical protein
MSATFISEAITPIGTSFLTAPMVAGEPGMPQSFSWHGNRIEVREVLDRWKELGDCSHGSGERYLRKHWYRIRTNDETEMKIYFERQARANAKTRWFLYSLTAPELSQSRTER